MEPVIEKLHAEKEREPAPDGVQRDVGQAMLMDKEERHRRQAAGQRLGDDIADCDADGSKGFVHIVHLTAVREAAIRELKNDEGKRHQQKGAGDRPVRRHQ
jgi:hypothetical protein